jgi:UDP-glucose 4-epimerase
METSVLVVGGAGYIGSHAVKRLARRGHRVTTLDNLSTGHRDAVLAGDFVLGDLRDREVLAHVFGGQRFDLVMHFAGLGHIGESIADPRRYYENNVVGALHLLDAMVAAGVGRLVFSSSCSVYGVPREVPVTEGHPEHPVSPYGAGKLFVERVLADYGVAYGLRSVALRYFNAAGCDHDGDLTERHEPETHLVPLVLREARRVLAGGARAETTLTVHGDDYATADGTCVRDYVHVDDLVRAHLLAAERLMREEAAGAPRFEVINLGSGAGASVLEVIAAVRAVTGVDIAYRVAGRRPGDPPVLVASREKAGRVLGWAPEITRIEDIVATAWRAMRR